MITPQKKKYKGRSYVICVDGSPIDCAASTPTGSPGCARLDRYLFSNSLTKSSFCTRPGTLSFESELYMNSAFSWRAEGNSWMNRLYFPSWWWLFWQSISWFWNKNRYDATLNEIKQFFYKGKKKLYYAFRFVKVILQLQVLQIL